MASILDMFAGPAARPLYNLLGGNRNMNSQSNNNDQGSFLGGTPAQIQQFERFRPNQQNAINQSLQMGLSGLQNTGNLDFGPIEQRAIKNFNTQIVPSLAERFTAMGSGPRSSNYAPTIAAAGADLTGQLAALRSQYGLQQQNALQNLLQIGLTPQYESAYEQRSPGFAESAGGPLLQALGQSLPYLLPLLLGGATGGAGAAAGAGISAGLPLLIKLLQSGFQGGGEGGTSYAGNASVVPTLINMLRGGR